MGKAKNGKCDGVYNCPFRINAGSAVKKLQFRTGVFVREICLKWGLGVGCDKIWQKK